MPNGAEEFKDRFTTHWTSPFDPRALSRVSSHIAESGSVSDFDGVNSPLPAMNWASDQGDRILHRLDTKKSTGTSFFYGDPADWFNTTRGCKLRTCDKDLKLYDGWMERIKEDRKELNDILSVSPGKQPEAEQLKNIVSLISAMQKVINRIKDIEQAALDELGSDWDWKKAREYQTALCTALSVEISTLDDASRLCGLQVLEPPEGAEVVTSGMENQDM